MRSEVPPGGLPVKDGGRVGKSARNLPGQGHKHTTFWETREVLGLVEKKGFRQESSQPPQDSNPVPKNLFPSTQISKSCKFHVSSAKIQLSQSRSSTEVYEIPFASNDKFNSSFYEINGKKFDSSPSFHNTAFAELMDNFKCICPPGFVVVAGFPCLCHLGPVHLRWERGPDGCIPNACEHDSPCKDPLPSYQCMCPPGGEGNFCEQESSDCKMNPCENNSTCTDLHNSYRCECTSGWTGQNCSEEINECDSDPCMNGALCHESTIPGQFVCLCPPFYTGKFCHQHYNPSDPLTDPCRNNATCLTLVDGNHCICREDEKG
ncbi:protein eyes shut homolog [Sturnira hondurensis]|uniref:protein eyes shut homolog n=1 Tax=Sturnira hondurensis TaxID=192404 RepID=UPI001879D326|nr:protein eyes shut homolog [Sturnira hondurensis]